MNKPATGLVEVLMAALPDALNRRESTHLQTNRAIREREASDKERALYVNEELKTWIEKTVSLMDTPLQEWGPAMVETLRRLSTTKGALYTLKALEAYESYLKTKANMRECQRRRYNGASSGAGAAASLRRAAWANERHAMDAHQAKVTYKRALRERGPHSHS